MPKPWGVTTLFAEFTGEHPPIEIQWSLDAALPAAPQIAAAPLPTASQAAVDLPLAPQTSAARLELASTLPVTAGYASFWDLALAVNRSNPDAIALASDGENSPITVDPAELKKLLGTLWFRSVFPRLSSHWRERTLNVLLETSVVPNHTLHVNRRDVRLSDLRLEEMRDLYSRLSIPEDVRADLRFVMTVGNLWGPESLTRLRYTEPPEAAARHSLPGRLLGIH